MKKCIAIFSDWYNDEIEVNGFIVMTDKEAENFEALLNDVTWSFTFNTGSVDLNYSSGEDLLTRIEFKDITNEQHKALSTVFEGMFGVFPTPEFIQEEILSGDDGGFDEEED